MLDRPPEEGAQLSPEALAKLLAAHKTWLATGGKTGAKADFRNADLRNADLRGANLRGADFLSADLRGANLLGVSFNEANLQDADLSDVRGLSSRQLAAANLVGTKLPDAIARFQTLDHVQEMSKNSAKLFALLMLSCVYCWLAVITTTDTGLLSNAPSSPLPIIQTRISIAGFYWVAPLILVALFIHFHLQLQRLWSELANLPAVFPDGKTIDETVYPWLLNGLAADRIEKSRHALAFVVIIETVSAIFAAWWFLPLTLVVMWLRYLPRHDWFGTGFEVVLIGITIFFAIWFQRLASSIIARRDRTPGAYLPLSIAASVSLVTFAVSYGAINGVLADEERRAGTGTQIVESGTFAWLSRTVPKIFDWLPIEVRAFANIDEQEVSTKLPGGAVIGAKLGGLDFRYGSAKGAFLVNAFLRGADLRGANFVGAQMKETDLRSADLRKAWLFLAELKGAELMHARLDQTYLADANLQTAQLNYARLQGAFMVNTDLRGADLRGASLQGAIMTGAKLQNAQMLGVQLKGAILDNANLEGVTGLTDEQMADACINDETVLPAGLKRPDACRPTETAAAPLAACERAPCRITLKSDAGTLAAALGSPGVPSDDIVRRLDVAAAVGRHTFVPVRVGPHFTSTPIPADAPTGTEVVNIPPGDGRSGYFKVSFVAPKVMSRVQLNGRVHADDVGRVFLNGWPISDSMFCGTCPKLVRQNESVLLSLDDPAYFRPGEINDIVIADANIEGGPSGATFYFTIAFSP